MTKIGLFYTKFATFGTFLVKVPFNFPVVKLRFLPVLFGTESTVPKLFLGTGTGTESFGTGSSSVPIGISVLKNPVPHLLTSVNYLSVNIL